MRSQAKPSQPPRACVTHTHTRIKRDSFSNKHNRRLGCVARVVVHNYCSNASPSSARPHDRNTYRAVTRDGMRRRRRTAWPCPPQPACPLPSSAAHARVVLVIRRITRRTVAVVSSPAVSVAAAAASAGGVRTLGCTMRVNASRWRHRSQHDDTPAG